MGALYDNVSAGLSKAGSAVSGAADKVMDFYTMPDKETYKQDYINEMRNTYKDFGQDVTKTDLANFEQEAGKLFSEEERKKRMRRGITGGLLGGALGYANHKANAGKPNRGPQVTSSSSGLGGGKLGTGYNPFNK